VAVAALLALALNAVPGLAQPYALQTVQHALFVSHILSAVTGLHVVNSALASCWVLLLLLVLRSPAVRLVLRTAVCVPCWYIYRVTLLSTLLIYAVALLYCNVIKYHIKFWYNNRLRVLQSGSQSVRLIPFFDQLALHMIVFKLWHSLKNIASCGLLTTTEWRFATPVFTGDSPMPNLSLPSVVATAGNGPHGTDGCMVRCTPDRTL
jgi:hypothetical protein